MSSPVQPEFDPLGFRQAAKAAGYSDAEIEGYVKKQQPTQATSIWGKIKQDSDRQGANLQKGLFEGLANQVGIAEKVASSSIAKRALPTVAPALSMLAGKGEDFLRSKIPQNIPEGATKTEKFLDGAMNFAGSVAAEVPANMGVAGLLRTGAKKLAVSTGTRGLTQQLLTGEVPGSFFKSAAASAPLNMIESVAVDAIIHPEDVGTAKGVARSAALGLIGTLGDGISGSRVGPMLGPKQADPIGQLLAGETPLRRTTLREIDQLTFDPAAPLKDFTDARYANSAYNLGRRLSGVEDQIHYIQNEKVTIPVVNTNDYVPGKGPTMRNLIRAIGPDPETLGEFDRYLLASSNYDLAADPADVLKQGIEIEQKFPQFKAAYQLYKDKTDDLVSMMQGYGMIDTDGAASMRAQGLYVPTSRKVSGGSQGNFLSPKKNTASMREIRSPMQQLVEIERRIIQQGEANKVGLAMLPEIRMDPGKWKGRLEIETKAVSDAPVEAEMADMTAQFKLLGKPVPPLKALRALAEARADQVLDGTTGTLRVRENGIAIDIKLGDPMIMDFYKARKYVEGSIIGDAARAAERFTTRTFFQPFRELTGKNAALDQMEAFFNTRWSEYIPGWDFAKGVFAEVTNDPRIGLIRNQRGAVSTRYADANLYENANRFEDFVKQSAQEAPGLVGRLMTPLKTMHELMGVLSSGTRTGAALRALDQGKSAGDAANMSRNVIADPQQRGTALAIKALSNSSFANYGLQTTRRITQAMQDNPGTFATKGLMAVTVPAAINWFVNKDDQEIQNLRKAKGGENYFFWRNPQSTEIYATQKPYLQGQMFGTTIESALDGMGEKEREELLGGLFSAVVPNPVPVTLGLAAELKFGKNWFGLFDDPTPMTSARVQGALPEDVAASNTFGISKAIAETSGIEAAKIDNFIKTLLFSQGTDVVDRLDRKIFNRMAAETRYSLIPATKMVNPNRSNTEPLNTFYTKLGEFGEIGKSFDLAKGSADPERVQQLMQQFPREIAKYEAYQAMNEVIGTINNAIRLTEENKSLSPQDRRERVNNLRKMMIGKADAWNKTVGNMK